MLSGCNKPAFIDRGQMHDFCGKTHAKQFEDQLRAQHAMSNRGNFGHPNHAPPSYQQSNRRQVQFFCIL